MSRQINRVQPANSSASAPIFCMECGSVVLPMHSTSIMAEGISDELNFSFLVTCAHSGLLQHSQSGPRVGVLWHKEHESASGLDKHDFAFTASQ
jgi:hypothetical protein